MSVKAEGNLERPVIPVLFFHDLFANCGTEVLQGRLREGDASPAVGQLYEAIQWMNEYKKEADRHAGMVSQEMNAVAVEQMLAGFDAWREFENMG